MHLSVRNNGTASFAAKYDGREYVFAPNQPTTIDADAARHIFGVGLADKTEVLTRHGWLSNSSDLPNAMARLDSFSFSIPNDNPDDEPVVELASLLTPVPVVEDNNEHNGDRQAAPSVVFQTHAVAVNVMPAPFVIVAVVESVQLPAHSSPVADLR